MEAAAPFTASTRHRSYTSAICFLAAVVVEKITVLYLPPHWMLGVVQRFGGAPAGFGLALLFFGWRRLSHLRLPDRWNRSALVTHVALLLLLLTLRPAYAHLGGDYPPTGALLVGMAALWTALIPLLVFTLLLIFVPLRSLAALVRSLGPAWLYAFAVTVAITLLRRFGATSWTAPSSSIYRFVQEACFQQTRSLLQHFYRVVVSDPEQHLLGTERFQIQVSWLCSGVEGLLLVAVLIPLWIVFFRRELIVRRAILVAPVALLLTWCANIVRLATLIAIGDHGHRLLADVGFHAQAGWISLNLITLGCLLVVQRHPWFRKHGGTATKTRTADEANYAVVYLLPFTLIVAASLITKGLSSGFEVLYVLRPAVALAALWLLRRHLRQIDWHCSATSVLAGLAVGMIWLGIRLKFRVIDADTMVTASALMLLSRFERWGWILARVVAASVIVPIAEELAFRGFAARRVMRVDFENQPYRQMNWVSLLVSSAAFGAMHGSMWIPGTLAGALFWWLAKSRNRIGDAVAAHAVANGVIALAAIHLRDYSLW